MRKSCTGRLLHLFLPLLLLAGTLAGAHPCAWAGVLPQVPPPLSSRSVAPPDSLGILGPASALQDTGAVTQEPLPERSSSVRDSVWGWGAVITTDGSEATFRGSVQEPARVSYMNMELTAGTIVYDTEKEILTALPMADTTEGGGGEEIHRPVFSQGDQRVVGDRMNYDLRAEKGVVFGADTAYEAGYYHGRRISAITGEPDYLLVRDASYTTCDIDDPHYHFAAKKMKIIPEDKVIGRHIVFYQRIPFMDFDMPLFYVPFLVRSIRTGRQSGLLMPKYSSNSLTGITLKDLGYYWAPSDYFDTRLALDLTEKQGIVVRSRTRYALRYKLQGNVEGTYNRDRARGVERWWTRFNHSHEVTPSLRLVAQGNFESSRNIREFEDNFERRLRRVLRSHLNASKRFESGASLSATVSQERYLDFPETVETTLPNLTFRVPRQPLFGSEDSGRERGGSPGGLAGFGFGGGAQEEETAVPPWYENLYVDYNLATLSRIRSTLEVSGSDTSRVTTDHSGLQQRANLTYSGRAGVLNIQPNFSAREAWYFGNEAEDGFQRRLLWDSSLRASTKIYGMTERPLGIDASFRHVVEPSISYVYSPDFTDLPEVPGTFGGAGGPQQAIRFSLGQVFQMKRQAGEQERKTDLARVSTSGSYNSRSRGGKKLSEISTSVNMNPARALSLQLNVVHDFYTPGTVNQQGVEPRFQWTPVTQNVTYRSSVRFSSQDLMSWLGLRGAASDAADEEEEPGETPSAEQQGEQEEDIPFASESGQQGEFGRQPARRRARGAALWNLRLNHDFGWQRAVETNRHSLDGSLSFNLPKWSLSWTARYDVARNEMVRQTFDIHRDLHCWEARLQVVATGPGRGFWFVINIKDIPEIKYEQRRTIYP
ncbi:MAG: putative LPS assembly protein LptD [bacterium]